MTVERAGNLLAQYAQDAERLKLTVGCMLAVSNFRTDVDLAGVAVCTPIQSRRALFCKGCRPSSEAKRPCLLSLAAQWLLFLGPYIFPISTRTQEPTIWVAGLLGSAHFRGCPIPNLERLVNPHAGSARKKAQPSSFSKADQHSRALNMCIYVYMCVCI